MFRKASVGAKQISFSFTRIIMAVKMQSTIDACGSVVNYPVAIGGVMELYSRGRDAPSKLRIFEIRSVGVWSVVVATGGHVARPGDIVGTQYGIKVRLYYSEVVLPSRYIFYNPFGWYVQYKFR